MQWLKKYEDMYGCSIGVDGELGGGFSCLTVTMDLTNPNGDAKTLFFDRGIGSFALLDSDGSHVLQAFDGLGAGTVSQVSFGGQDMASDGLNPTVIEPGAKAQVKTVCIVPDSMVEDPGLLYLVDSGFDYSGPDAGTGRPQAFAVGGLV